MCIKSDKYEKIRNSAFQTIDKNKLDVELNAYHLSSTFLTWIFFIFDFCFQIPYFNFHLWDIKPSLYFTMCFSHLTFIFIKWDSNIFAPPYNDLSFISNMNSFISFIQDQTMLSQSCIQGRHAECSENPEKLCIILRVFSQLDTLQQTQRSKSHGHIINTYFDQ